MGLDIAMNWTNRRAGEESLPQNLLMLWGGNCSWQEVGSGAPVMEVSDDNRNCCYADQSVSRNCAKADRTQL